MSADVPFRLVKKLAEVMKAVERVPKRGWNDFHKYHFATEADIAEALRTELATRGVMLIPGIASMEREKVGEKGQVLTTLFMTMTFIDAETGETIERPWLGAGTDKEDKGAYKAMTGGEKYFLLKTFLIPTGDDPEGEGEAAAPAGEAVNAAAIGPAAPPLGGVANPATHRSFAQPVRKPQGKPLTADDIPF